MSIENAVKLLANQPLGRVMNMLVMKTPNIDFWCRVLERIGYPKEGIPAIVTEWSLNWITKRGF
jgi:hypothetical protein